MPWTRYRCVKDEHQVTYIEAEVHISVSATCRCLKSMRDSLMLTPCFVPRDERFDWGVYMAWCIQSGIDYGVK
jgi:hypothetical protein